MPMWKDEEDFEIDEVAVVRLNKDLKIAATKITRREARYLVDMYYAIQLNRQRAASQMRAALENNETVELVEWVFNQNKILETQIKSALSRFAEAHPFGPWCMSICGVGPVITSGLIAHIDINKSPHLGHILSFGGMAANQKEWKKKQVRPWNARLKVLFYKIGESFVKQQGREQDIYGKMFREYKDREIKKNENGELAPQAAAQLEKKNFGKTTDAYKAYIQGMLPPAHIHARARRFCIKIFLSHLHEVWTFIETGTRPPAPYAMAMLGHSQYVEVPHTHLIDGWQ